MAKKKFIFEFRRAPGDVLMLSALVRDLKLTYGDEYLVDVSATFPHLWENNPYLDQSEYNGPTQRIDFWRNRKNSPDRIAMAESRRGAGKHYCTAFHAEFTNRTGIPLAPLFPHADLHLTDQEKTEPKIKGRYWVIIPGGKADMTTKIWRTANFQEVVNKLKPWGFSFVQEGAAKPGHIHPELSGVLDLRGKTHIRELICNIWHADGVICGCSLPMHIAGALQKPCVVLMGGREEPAFECYSNTFPGSFGPKAAPVQVEHKMLHTIGLLPCCLKRGCWLRRVEKMSKRADFNRSLCKMPDHSDSRQAVPACMAMIEPNHVVAAMMQYYIDGTIRPLPSWPDYKRKEAA
jgi:hypothetical protein